jgi:hypothetical protein
MREPVFNETLQLGIVVRDLEATVRRYEDDYGIGPWTFARIDLGEENNYREYGRPAERSKNATADDTPRAHRETEHGDWAGFLMHRWPTVGGLAAKRSSTEGRAGCAIPNQPEVAP